MKVYVVYASTQHEGDLPPEAAFREIEAAERYVTEKETEPFSLNRWIVELELQ